MRASLVHRSSSLSDFQRIFCHRPRSRGNGEPTQSSIFRIKKLSLRFFLSSIPRHRLCSLLYSNERPYTNPGWPVHSRRRFCYMQEVFFFYARERLAFSPDRCVFCFVLAFTFLSFFLEGNTLRGAWGTLGRANEGRATLRAWEVGAWKTGYASTTRALLRSPIVDTNRENFESDLTRREQRSINFFFFFFDGSVVCWVSCEVSKLPTAGGI